VNILSGIRAEKRWGTRPSPFLSLWAAKHNFLWQFPLDIENNIFNVAFHKIFHPTAPGQIALGLYSFA